MVLPRLLAGRVHYAWIVVAITFLVMLNTAGVRSTPGVLIVPLEHAFGWGPATISAAVSVNIFVYGLIGPFAAALMQTLGLRRTLLIALSLLTVAVAASGFITAPWQLFATWGFSVGLAAGATATGLAATIANRWFVARRGLVIGLLTASNASGQLVFLPLFAAIAAGGHWRTVSFVVAGITAILIPLVAWLLPEAPREIGLIAYGASADAPLPVRANPVGVAFAGLARGVRSIDFWLLFVSFAICGFSTNGLIGTHLIAYCIDHGIPEVSAAGLLAAIGVFDLIGTTASGWLSDRFNARYLLFWYYGLRGLSLVLLPFTSFDVVSLSVFAVFYGLDWVATVPPTVMLTNEVFGKQDAPVIVSWIFTGHQMGAALAAFGAGAVRGATGSYFDAFVASGLACLLAALLVLRIARTRSVEAAA